MDKITPNTPAGQARHTDQFTPGSPEWRMERFAELRAYYPTFSHDEILEALHDSEVDALEAIEGRRILSEMEG